MKIGIVSDSHGKARRLRQALAALVQQGARVLVHCGDVGSPECIAALGETGLDAYAVAGNMDRRIDRLTEQARQCGVRFSSECVVVPLGDGQYLAATHGNDPAGLARLLEDPNCPYVCHGHTHRARDERIGDTRVINPGALRHARPATVALLDTDTDTVEHIELK